MTKPFSHTRIYLAWSNMMRRCYEKTRPEFKNYGGRGITVCDRWHDVHNFIADMGPHPGGKPREWSLDRIDNEKGYSPENCRWAKQSQQMRNTRFNRLLTFNGQTRCLKEWAEVLGVDRSLLKNRVRYGWGAERILTEPVWSAKARCAKAQAVRLNYPEIPCNQTSSN